MSKVVTESTGEEFDYVLRYSKTCDAGAERQGDAVPCERPAVAVAADTTFGEGLYPVCAYHANRNGACLTLSEVIRLAQGTA
jgi:hypothetical protein